MIQAALYPLGQSPEIVISNKAGNMADTWKDIWDPLASTTESRQADTETYEELKVQAAQTDRRQVIITVSLKPFIKGKDSQCGSVVILLALQSTV